MWVSRSQERRPGLMCSCIGVRSSTLWGGNWRLAWPPCSHGPAPAGTATCRACAALPRRNSRRRNLNPRERRTMPTDPAVRTAQEALQADAAARAAALDPSRSFLLQAPAGSGKTTVLSCRLLGLLAHVDAPEEILAITFTRKAASEMRARVLNALQAARQGAGEREFEAPLAAAALRRDHERDWRLLETPARLRVMTIDAYCQTLAAQLPIASRNGQPLEN